MPWELRQTAEFEQRYGQSLLPYAERLRALLEQNGVPPPRFPGMVWAADRLPDGVGIVVGIAEGEDGPLAYVFPADRVELDRTEPMTLDQPGPAGVTPVTVHWYSPPG